MPATTAPRSRPRPAWAQFLDAGVTLLHAASYASSIYEYAQQADSGTLRAGLFRLAEAGTGSGKGMDQGPVIGSGARQYERFDAAMFAAGIRLASFPRGANCSAARRFLDVGGYRDVGLIEDVDLYIRLASCGLAVRLVSLAGALNYPPIKRHHSGSLSTGSQLAFSDGVARNAAMVRSWARASPMLAGQVLSARIVDCYFQAHRSFAGHDWPRASMPLWGGSRALPIR